ncbi:MAG: SPASM domain-containing protein [Alphaproteobacteria bacterium]|nr:SPASM domain-containing protein [Alphaproteobacteria bacterium]
MDLGLKEKISIQIETINYCNRKCKFCFFGHWEPLSNLVMPMTLYERILDQVCDLPVTVNLVAHSSYADPTIDPHFFERLEMLKARGLGYWNITNGTNLTEEVLDYFLDNLPLIRRFFLIDVPTLDGAEYQELAGGPAAQAEKLRQGLHRLGPHIKPKSINARLIVLGWCDEAHHRNVAAIKAEFEPYGYQVILAAPSDRAGELRPFIDEKIERQTVAACTAGHFDGFLYFGVSGNLYGCCHDYTQRFTFGNVKRTKLLDILTSDQRREMLEAMKAQMCRRCVSAVESPLPDAATPTDSIETIP